ncbi:hypothetical protein GF373_05950 [bacterium]|nr:hypothetical protein [bacterium]
MAHIRLSRLLTLRFFLFGLVLLTLIPDASSAKDTPYLAAVQSFADCVLAHGLDTHGEEQTPLFADGLHVQTLQPVVWRKDGEEWILSNFASQQPLLRTLDGLTGLTGEASYRQAAKAATNYALTHLVSPSGLLYWGGHMAWDLRGDRDVGQYASDIHELKSHQPYYTLFWRVNPKATARLLGAIWGTHILDWSRLDYNRHAKAKQPQAPKWDHPFDTNIAVPFPAQGSNLSFVNVTPPLLHTGVVLAGMGDHKKALQWTERLLRRWQDGKHPQTGLCGGQLSYREHDRAQDALGHVHPEINEAQIVASYHQTCRYHRLPLAQMQAGERLQSHGGAYAEAGKRFIRWALNDLAIYAKHCYNKKTGKFVAVMIDGTPLQWQKAKTDYYTPQSFAPRNPDGSLFWGYAMAYRLGHKASHWRIVREIARQLDLGDVGKADGAGRRLRFETNASNWQYIYALLELHRATKDKTFLRLARRIGDTLVSRQSQTGLFPRSGWEYARTGDEIPLALLHLSAALAGKADALPRPMMDSRFFHCEFDGPLEKHQQKRADRRTYDSRVFYGD